MTSYIVLGLAALAAASPLPSISEGFKLRIEVTDPSRDFTPSVDGRDVVGVHIGAGLNMVTPALHNEYATFHTNGTASELWAARGTIVEGFGKYAMSWNNVRSEDSPYLSSSVLQYGPGTEGVRVLEEPGEVLRLGPGQYMVCDHKLPYGLSVELTVENVPEECIPVRLVPVCTELAPNDREQEGGEPQHLTCTRCKNE